MLNDIKNPIQEESRNAWKAVAIGLGILVYLAVLFFTGAHNINLMSIGVSPEWRWAAYLGVLALEISAIAFPIGLHFWAFAPLHRGALILFYIGDFVLLFANTIIDYAMVSGGEMPAWGAGYLVYFAPGSPLYALASWAILLALDPRSRQNMQMEQIQAGIRLQLMRDIQNSMTSDDVLATINDEAQDRAAQITRDVLAGDKVIGNNGRAVNPTRASSRKTSK